MNTAETKKVLNGAYTITIQGFDYGCACTKASLKLDGVVDALDKGSIKVTEHKQTTDFSKVPEFPVVVADFPRTVLDAYLTDAEGKKTEQPSCYAVIEMDESPMEGNVLLFSMHTMLNTWSQPYELHFAAEGITSGGVPAELNIAAKETGRVTDADLYEKHTFTAAAGTQIQYACWSPEGGSKNLVVWLHGLGEGGTKATDPYVTLLANKDSVLAKEAFQNTVGGANILVPQCPTWWMDGDGTGANLTGSAIHADEHSFYTEALHELIVTYKEQTGSEKVVITGCSNGGYMTVVMAMNYPELCDAIVPICEAVPNKCISDQVVETLKDIPSYYVFSKDDDVVDPSLHELPLLERLKKAGAKEIHVYNPDHVVDTSGKYHLPDGKPWKYSGHWSWIYFFNNECDAEGLKAWDFVADHLK